MRKTKIKHIIALFLIAVFFTVIGAFFKIMHWAGGNEMLYVAFGLKGIVIILAIWKVLTTDRFKSFLNK